MATASRVLWKGAINFGLVHIPVRVHPATRAGGVDFDWLDRRTLDPVDRPYYLVPDGKSAKVYALLREALAKTGRIGLARVVIQTRQHLAALVPAGPDLAELLRRSLRGGGKAGEGGAAIKSAAKKAAGKAPPAKKPPAAAKKRAA